MLRKEEDTAGTKESEDTLLTEGETTFNSSFIKSVSTEIVIDRKFTIPGYVYNLTLVSYNMHDITAPNIIMRWHIECQNPVVPEDWSLLYHPNIHFGQTFEVTLQIEPEKALPTRPTRPLPPWVITLSLGTRLTLVEKAKFLSKFSLISTIFT